MVIVLLSLTINLDIAQFSLSPEETYCEIYYSMPTKGLKFNEAGGKFTAEFPVILRITDKATKETFSETFHKTVNVSNLDEELEFSDVRPVVLGSKKRYNIRLEIENIKEEPFWAETTIVSRDWGDKFQFSDIQVSHTLLPTTEENSFVKNGYKLIPFPRRTFSKNRYLLASYCELYGLKEDSVLITYIITGRGDEIDTVFNSYYETAGDMIAIPMIANVLGYSPGTYTLNLIARGDLHVVMSSKRFSIKEIKRKATFSIPDSILEYASFINYIASPREVRELNSLTLPGKKLFLLKFWSRRDPDPDTRENEVLIDFVTRVKNSDQNFSTEKRGKEGRFTDRGRIYIKYGPPDDIIRRTSELEVDPYIIWHYFDIGGWFVFMERNMSGEYDIIYSSIDAEPTEPNWEGLILPEDRSKISGPGY